MDNRSEIMEYDPMVEGQQEISGLRDADLRANALELWNHASTMTADQEKRFLPATIIQIADLFSGDQADALTALSAAGVFLEQGELALSGQLDETDISSIEDILDVMNKMGLAGLDVGYLADHFGLNMSLGVLGGLKALGEHIEEMSPSEIADIRRETGLHLDVSDDEFDDQWLTDIEDSEDLEYDGDDDDDASAEDEDEESSEALEKESRIAGLQMILGRLGMTGVNVITIATILGLSPEDSGFVEELSNVLDEIAGDEGLLEELRFKTDAGVIQRDPQDIASALAEYHAVTAPDIDDEDPDTTNSDGTTSTDTDASGEEFTI